MIKPSFALCMEPAPRIVPYCDMSQTDWERAWEIAADRIWDEEDRERAPGIDEVLAAYQDDQEARHWGE